MPEATAIILCGGKNSRMGCNKALLEVGRQKIIERMVRQLSGLFGQIIISSNEPLEHTFPEVEAVPDIIPGRGPLSGIHAGLAAAGNHYSLVLACDMPFVDGKLAEYLIKEAPGFDVVVPRVDQYLQPLFAVYSKNCLAPVTECLKSSNSKVITFYHRVKVKYISREKISAVTDVGRVFFNINTPADLKAARFLAGISAGDPVPVISIVGKSGSGKTTLLENLIPEIKRRGYRVAVIKHSDHDFAIDRPGKDTYRHFQAGADAVVISSTVKTALVARTGGREYSLDELVRQLPPVDLVLTEGYKTGNRPKIEVRRKETGEGPICPAGDLLALVTGEPPDAGAPCFAPDDAAGIVDLIESRFLRKD